MKKSITTILLFVSLGLFSQQQAAYTAAWPADWTLDQNTSALELVLELQKAAENSDYTTARLLFHSDFTAILSDGSPLNGLDEMDAAFKDFINNYNIRIRPLTWIPLKDKATDQRWVLLWTYEQYVASDSSSQQLTAHEMFRIKDGKIIYLSQWQRPLK
tara:strand:+ start:2359 stop:2835 length:477 start_codon:yes stop_codon:yes gene_type:complete